MQPFLTLFNEVSLSPYHDLGDRVVYLLGDLARHEAIAVSDQLDFLARLLKQLGRHLTAYDLITFHHRGANYPDALLLDTLLKSYLGLIERHPELLAGSGKEARSRRRALRQGWLIRRFYEGHLVPDAPTSPGENNRVLPGHPPRVPEEQILQTNSAAASSTMAIPSPRTLAPMGWRCCVRPCAICRHPNSCGNWDWPFTWTDRWETARLRRSRIGRHC